MARSSKASGRKKVSAKRWREEQRGGSIYLKVPSGIGTFQEKAEKYRLDFMSYTTGKGNPRADEGEEYFERTFFVHQGIGPNKEWHLCLAKTFRKPCPVCEFRAKQMADPDADEDLIKSLAPKERQLWLVRNLQEDPKAVLLWEISYHLFGKQLRDKINNADEEDGYDYFADSAEGFSVRIAFVQSDRGKWREAVDIEFRPRKVQYDTDAAEESPCLDDMLVATPYDKLKKLFLQVEESEEDAEDDQDDDAPPVKSEKKKEKTKTKPKAEAVEVEVGGTVFYDGSPCEVLKIGGDDGEKLMVEDMDGEIHKITMDDVEQPPAEKKAKPKPKKEEKEADDDDDWDDDDDELEEKPKAKPKSKAKKEKEPEDDKDDDNWDDWDD